jgi:hypothetical protein
MSVMTEGSKKLPAPAIRDPPRSSRAPRWTLVLTCASSSAAIFGVASGPMSVFGSMGSPMRRARMPPTRRRSKSSATDSTTMNRLAAMHDWPLLIVRAVTATVAARSTSAVASTTNGSLPPSSSTVFLSWRPATAATSRPAGSLPVSVTPAMRLSAMSPETRSAPMSSVWNTPEGQPARRNRSSSASAHCGTFDACLSSATFPAASAGAANRTTCQKGKFHGITARITPSGWKATNPTSRPAFTMTSRASISSA